MKSKITNLMLLYKFSKDDHFHFKIINTKNT